MRVIISIIATLLAATSFGAESELPFTIEREKKQLHKSVGHAWDAFAKTVEDARKRAVSEIKSKQRRIKSSDELLATAKLLKEIEEMSVIEFAQRYVASVNSTISTNDTEQPSEIAGEYTWYNGDVLTIQSDGAVTSAKANHDPAQAGRWQRVADSDKNEVKMEWSHSGWWIIGTFEDGRFDGINKVGKTVWGQRVKQ